MGLSYRILLLDRHDRLYRLQTTRFEQMLIDAASHRVARFAGERVRMAGVVVALLDRQPTYVVHRTFSIVSFDAEGQLDSGAFERHQRACVEQVVAPLFAQPEHSTTVVEAADRFVAQGGRWVPSRVLARRIDDVALVRAKCERL